MEALFFEVTPKPGHEERYFERVAALKPELEKHTGLLFLDRYRSHSRDGMFLSHQFWKDEASIARWRANCPHYHTQVAGRNVHFEDYRLRVGPVIRTESEASGDDLEQRASHYLSEDEADRLLLVVKSAGPLPDVPGETFESVNHAGQCVALCECASRDEAEVLIRRFRDHDGFDAAHLVRLSRDYGMFDRAEAPQYMAEPRAAV